MLGFKDRKHSHIFELIKVLLMPSRVVCLKWFQKLESSQKSRFGFVDFYKTLLFILSYFNCFFFYFPLFLLHNDEFWRRNYQTSHTYIKWQTTPSNIIKREKYQNFNHLCWGWTIFCYFVYHYFVLKYSKFKYIRSAQAYVFPSKYLKKKFRIGMVRGW